MARTTTESEGEYTCKSCGAKERANYIQPIKEQMLTKQFCYNCNYWDEFRKKPAYLRATIIDGTVYYPGERT